MKTKDIDNLKVLLLEASKENAALRRRRIHNDDWWKCHYKLEKKLTKINHLVEKIQYTIEKMYKTLDVASDVGL